MATQTDGSSGDGDGDAPSARATELARRFIACAAGLPRLGVLRALPAQKTLSRRRPHLRAPSRGASAQALCLGAGPAKLGKTKPAPGRARDR